MALPTLSKTWEHPASAINIAAATSTADETDVDETMLAIKNALTDANFTAPWTVVASSDGSTADASDNWTDIGDIVHNSAPTAHSWIVLEAPVGDFQICFDTGFSSSLPERWGVYISMTAGFTGGTTTARPTATDEQEVSNITTNIFPTTTFNAKVHCMISDDGEETRLFVCINGNTTIVLFVGELADTDLADPTWCFWSPDSDGINEMLNIDDLWSRGQRFFNDGGSPASYSFSGEAVQENTTNTSFRNVAGWTAVNAQNSEWHIGPVGAWGPHGTARAGKLGNIADLFWGSVTNNTGDQYPSAGTQYQFSQFGVFIVPWDSATPVQVA